GGEARQRCNALAVKAPRCAIWRMRPECWKAIRPDEPASDSVAHGCAERRNTLVLGVAGGFVPLNHEKPRPNREGGEVKGNVGAESQSAPVHIQIWLRDAERQRRGRRRKLPPALHFYFNRN